MNAPATSATPWSARERSGAPSDLVHRSWRPHRLPRARHASLPPSIASATALTRRGVRQGRTHHRAGVCIRGAFSRGGIAHREAGGRASGPPIDGSPGLSPGEGSSLETGRRVEYDASAADRARPGTERRGPPAARPGGVELQRSGWRCAGRAADPRGGGETRLDAPGRAPAGRRSRRPSPGVRAPGRATAHARGLARPTRHTHRIRAPEGGSEAGGA